MHCPMRKKRPICDADFSAIVLPSMHGSGYLDYTVETHASRSMKAMEEFRQQELLCDLVLHVTYKDKTVDFKVRHQTPCVTPWMTVATGRMDRTTSASVSTQVHKVVLASCSPYFRAMFTSSFRECSAPEVTLRDVCPQVLGRLIDFAYTSHITVGEKCVLHLLLAAMR